QWPCGYAAKSETIARFGAFNRAQVMPAYAVNPTLYLIGSDGLIRWGDRQARLRHEAGPVLRELEAGSERALAAPRPGGGEGGRPNRSRASEVHGPRS